jgi:hypothetical protein
MQRYTFAFLWPEKHYQCKGREENYTAIPSMRGKVSEAGTGGNLK